MVINGNLKFISAGAGEIQNAVIERLASDPTGTAGQLYYNTTNNELKFHNGTAWFSVASGGAAASQVEMDATQTSMGYVNADGTYNAAILDALGNVTGSSSLASALTQLDTAITAANGVNAVPDLTDVTITTSAANELLFTTGANTWVNQTLVEAGIQAQDVVLDDLSGLAAVAADQMIVGTGANTFAYATITAAGLALLDDVSNTVQRATLGLVIGTDVQAFDAGLAALATLSGAAGTGLVVQTGVDTFINRTVVESATAGLVITNGDGVAGNPSIAIEAGLDSIAGLTMAADEMLYATADNVFASTALTATARGLLDDASEGAMRTTLGLVAGGVGDIWVERAGDAMTGNLLMATNKITTSYTPVDGVDLVNKTYVDNLLAGLTWKNAVAVATTGNVTLSGEQTIDGVLTSANRILVKDQTTPAENGIYLTGAGAWTRVTDMDTGAEFDGAAVFVQQGTANADKGYTQTATVATVGTDTVTFVEFSGGASITDGIGLTFTGSTLDVNLGAGIAQLPADEIGIDLYDAVNGALILTPDGTARGTLTGDALHLLLNGTTLQQSSAGLSVNEIVNANVAAAAAINFSKLEALAPGNILVGSAGNVVSEVTMSGDVTIIASGATTIGLLKITTGMVQDNAVTLAKMAGLASANFILGSGAGDPTAATMSGDATMDNLGAVTLTNNSLTLAANTGVSEDVALGETLTIAGGTLASTVVSATNTVTINVAANVGDLGDATALNDVAGEIMVDAGGTGGLVPQMVQFIYGSDGTAATTHTVTHNLGQQFCNVTVLDDTSNDVIIPESISLDTANQLVVTFNTAIHCKVIVMGIPGVVETAVTL